MARSLVVIAAALLLGACSACNFSSNADETAGWSAQKLYQEAKER